MLLHLGQLSRGIDQDIQGKVRLDKIVDLLQPIQKTLSRFFDDDQIQVAVLVVLLASTRTEKNDFLREATTAAICCCLDISLPPSFFPPTFLA